MWECLIPSGTINGGRSEIAESDPKHMEKVIAVINKYIDLYLVDVNASEE